MRGYLAAIPTYVIVRPYPGLLGAAALLSDPCFADLRNGGLNN
jgi:glucokinase